MKVLLRVGFMTLALLLAALMLLAACGEEETTTTTTQTTTTTTTTTTPTTTPGGAQYGGVLKYAVSQGPTGPFGFWPEGASMADSDATGGVCFEEFMIKDGKGNYLPNLALTWELAPDLTSCTFTVRKGVKFHDGTDYNAQAQAWDFDFLLKGRWGYMWESIDVIDDYTFRINFFPGVWNNNFFLSVSSPNGRPVSPTAYETKGVEWLRHHPVGTGPFKFISHESGVKVTYERNDDYWQEGKPYLDGVEFVVIPNNVTRQLAFEANQVHVIEGVFGQQAADLIAKGYDYVVSVPQSAPMLALLPDSNTPTSPFADRRVRLALEYAIDKEAISAATGYGLSYPLSQLAATGSIAYVPELEGTRQYDPEEAKQLLADAGHPHGFKTKITVDPRYGNRDAVVAIQRYLAEVDITAELDFPTLGKYMELERNPGTWEGLLAQGMVTFAHWTGHTRYHWDVGFGLNSIARPEGFQELNTKTMTTPFVEKDVCQEWVRMVYDNAMVIPIMASQTAAFFREGVHDTGVGAWTGADRFWTPWDTRLEPSAYIK